MGYEDESTADLDTSLTMIEDDAGTYSYNSIEGTIEGVADGGKLHGTRAQGRLSGSFEFTMSRDSQSHHESQTPILLIARPADPFVTGSTTQSRGTPAYQGHPLPMQQRDILQRLAHQLTKTQVVMPRPQLIPSLLLGPYGPDQQRTEVDCLHRIPPDHLLWPVYRISEKNTSAFSKHLSYLNTTRLCRYRGPTLPTLT